MRRIAARSALLAERLDARTLALGGALHVDPTPLAVEGCVAAFAFRWGAVVTFGAEPGAERALRAALEPHLTNPLAVPVTEDAVVEDGAAEDGVTAAGVIALKALDADRLAVAADALAKSAALTQQETRLGRTLDAMDPVIARLSRQGRIGFGARRLLQAVGDSLAARSRSWARVQVEDAPDTLWEHPELRRLHARLAEEYELAARSAALGRKLEVIGDTTQTLLTLIETRRSLALELGVLSLIALEAATTVYGLFFE
jgi:uncharacterized Rmd1/YagE family protein